MGGGSRIHFEAPKGPMAAASRVKGSTCRGGLKQGRVQGSDAGQARAQGSQAPMVAGSTRVQGSLNGRGLKQG